jgi:hypothetical protein
VALGLTEPPTEMSTRNLPESHIFYTLGSQMEGKLSVSVSVSVLNVSQKESNHFYAGLEM